jgi:NAD(P)-dependent dehydrogenase (short-subunit alcohol dehydrogenase family)
LDILINNAGILIDENQSALKVSMNIIKETFETNLIGPYKLIQSFIPLMKKHNYGRILNISSGMGSFAEMGAGYAGYRISKITLNAMTKILAYELVESNILINSMSPDWVRTDMGGSNASRSVEEGANTAIWLSKLPNGGPGGKFYRDRKEISW